MAALALYALFMVMGDMFETRTRVLKLFIWAMVLPYLANTTGWLLTELGRFPWVVYGLMKIEDGRSPVVSSGSVLFSLIAFTLLYGALMVADIYLLNKYAKAGPSGAQAPVDAGSGDQFPSLVGAND